MTPQQALEVLVQVGRKFVGNADDHDLIRQALTTLAGAIASPVEEPKKEEVSNG